MKTRILTGVVGIPIVLLCIFGPTPLIYLLGFVMMAALNYELAHMQGEEMQRMFMLFCFVNMLAAFACYTFVTQELGLIFALVNVLVMAETVFTYPKVGLSEMLYLAFINIYCASYDRAAPSGQWCLDAHERFHHGLDLRFRCIFFGSGVWQTQDGAAPFSKEDH